MRESKAPTQSTLDHRGTRETTARFGHQHVNRTSVLDRTRSLVSSRGNTAPLLSRRKCRNGPTELPCVRTAQERWLASIVEIPAPRRRLRGPVRGRRVASDAGLRFRAEPSGVCENGLTVQFGASGLSRLAISFSIAWVTAASSAPARRFAEDFESSSAGCISASTSRAYSRFILMPSFVSGASHGAASRLAPQSIDVSRLASCATLFRHQFGPDPAPLAVKSTARYAV